MEPFRYGNDRMLRVLSALIQLRTKVGDNRELLIQLPQLCRIPMREILRKHGLSFGVHTIGSSQKGGQCQ